MSSTLVFTEYDYVVGGTMSEVTVTVQPREVSVSVSTGPITIGTGYSTQEDEGSPVGVVTPEFKGQIYFDTLNEQLYVSSGLSNTSWIEVLRNY